MLNVDGVLFWIVVVDCVLLCFGSDLFVECVLSDCLNVVFVGVLVLMCVDVFDVVLSE